MTGPRQAAVGVLTIPLVPIEQRLRWSLAAVLRKLGLIGKVTPSDGDLVRIASAYAKHTAMFGGVKVASTDQGEPFEFGKCLAPPNPAIDKDIPF